MTNTLIQSLNADITALNWVERYGGLVRTVQRVVQGMDDNGSTFPIVQAFPIGCNVSALACWEEGSYNYLVPDDELKSVCYFEEVTSMRLAASPLPNMNRFTGLVKFVAWLNLKKLGYTDADCDISTLAQIELSNALSTEFMPIRSKVNGLLSMKPTEFPIKGNDIFTKYSYNDKQHLLFYPFDFFSVVFEINIDFNELCATPFVAQPPIIC